MHRGQLVVERYAVGWDNERFAWRRLETVPAAAESPPSALDDAPPSTGDVVGCARPCTGAAGPSRNAQRDLIESLEGDDAPAIVSAVDEAGRQLRAPWAASVAGILFSILFTVGLVLLRDQPLLRASDAEILQIFDDGRDLPAVIGGLYLAPFAGIMFLWFVAVIRDQLGERADRVDLHGVLRQRDPLRRALVHGGSDRERPY